MIVKHRRLSKLLNPSGFVLAYLDNRTFDIVHVRRSSQQDLFEIISVGMTVKQRGRAQAAGASVGCSIVPGKTALRRGLMEDRCMMEMATEDDGWCEIPTDTDAIAWERKLAELGPLAAAEFADKYGPNLLAATAGARAASERYLKFVNLDASVETEWARLKALASPEQRKQAHDLIRNGPIMRLPEGWNLYDLTGLCVVLNWADVEGSPRSFEKSDPFTELELLWRLQIIASRIAKEPGWSLPQPSS